MFSPEAEFGRACTQYLRQAWCLLALIGLSQAAAQETGLVERLAAEVRADFRHHYSLRQLGNVALGFGVTGLLANSDVDREVQDYFQQNLRSTTGDDLARFFTDVGDLAQPPIAAPIYFGLMWLGDYGGPAESAMARWGGNSLRAMLVGTPELIALSEIAGGSRPEEGEPGWEPFADDNAVSGHAFFGAVPIISAARLTDKRWLRYTLYGVSTLPGFARVYDDKHYFSQSFMGWWLAYAATRTVRQTNLVRLSAVQVTAIPYPDGGGLQISLEF